MKFKKETIYKKKRKNHNMNNIISFILLLLFVILFIISSQKIIDYIKDSKKNEKVFNEISKDIEIQEIPEDNNEDNKYKIDFESLKQKNNDTVGFLKVNGTDIEQVVVKGKDNGYYLYHNFEKQENSSGWIFADYRNKLDGTDKNIIIYGHNMLNNKMFGTLKNILNEEWYSNEENLVIDFITEQEQVKYQVFSVYKIKNEDYYINTEFKKNEFSEFIKTLKNRSIKDFEIEVTENDSILTLSTCADNNKYRIVLHSKKTTD